MGCNILCNGGRKKRTVVTVFVTTGGRSLECVKALTLWALLADLFMFVKVFGS
jgi:hypothetical protein